MKRLGIAATLALLIHGLLLVIVFPKPKHELPKLSEFKTLNFSLLEEKPKAHEKEKISSPPLTQKVKKELKKEKQPLQKPLPPPPLVPKKVQAKQVKVRPKAVKDSIQKPLKPLPTAPMQPPITDTVQADSPLPPITPSAALPTVNKDNESASAQVIRAARPLYLENPPPDYPRVARKRRYQGVVMLEVLVDQRGAVADVRLFKTSGYGILDRAALKSVTGWKFEPARRGNRPVSMWVRVPIRFRLED